ncbi:unnamed protein product [Mytilus coruscus]|uniref:DUF6729 domain-containing protein n=1 Tax=Mytilus coruscus TaxID=42192 RepID=A0A6J8C378_MYTCO|nr:unnamed protein product [Mytilus coruscus]
MQPCDQRWISKSLFRVNQQGKPEMCFDGITQMWYQPPQPPLQCTQPPLLDRYFSRPTILWMPKKLWRVLLSCPDQACNKRELTSAGLYHTRLTVRPSQKQPREGSLPLAPSQEKVLSYQWLTTVFCRDVLSRLDEVKASLTSPYGRVIKVDSTKRFLCKLQGMAAGTASLVTNVGNKHGQILMSVVTAEEGAGLDAMLSGLENRYSDAGTSPPEVLYVDRDCCGPNFVGKKFHKWKEIKVRLDIWHFMRRLASTYTTESHPLYPKFMRQLSGCIFQWCSEDLEVLKGAKEDQLATDGVPSGQPIDWITKKELSLHCRCTTRISEDITDLISELLKVYCGEHGRDLLGTPLLDANKVEEIRKVQQNHVPCILDPPGSQLYVQTGVLKKGGHMLPTYRCARGSTSLESFHLHLNRFIPVNRLAEKVLGNPLDHSFQAPRVYTGELLGVEYLYAQTGRALQTVLEENEEEEERKTEEQPDMDEGFVDDLDDMTIPEARS